MRDYRLTQQGEKPVWASRARIERTARLDAYFHRLKGYEPCYPSGNLVYDAAYKAIHPWPST